MHHINADMGTIVALANEIDAYQAELRRLQAGLGQHFARLASDGHWTDHRYADYRNGWMEPLGHQFDFLHALIDNELKPCLSEVYQRLMEYRDA